MIRATAKSHLGIIFKNISLAAVLVLGLSQTAKADEANKHQDLRISCDPTVNQASRLNCSFNTLPPEIDRDADTLAQGNRGRRRKSKVQGYYGGFSLGAMFPTGAIKLTDIPGFETLSDVEYGTGFAGSAFGGVKFNKNLGAELEFLIGTGNGDSDDFNDGFAEVINNLGTVPGVGVDGAFTVDADYTVFALYASPRFDLPISDKFNVFVSPGIGFSQTNVTTEIQSDLQITGAEAIPDIDAINDLNGADLDEDLSRTGISFKIKAGAEYKISNSIGIFGQATYVTLPTDDTDLYDVENLNSFLTQAGLTYNF